jgi:excinuclease ABC subunit B
MERAIKETNRRRKIQDAYNKSHGIVPKTIVKGVRDVIEISTSDEAKNRKNKRNSKNDATGKMTKADREAMIDQLTAEMKRSAKQLDFERAAMLRDKIKILREEM